MTNLKCENCGNTNLIEKNGIVTCSSCGTKYPHLNLENIDPEADLKQKEIKRLLENPGINDPNTALLTDDEILKYAPKSDEALSIRFKRAKGLEKLKVDYFITLIIIFVLICILLPIIITLTQ